MPITTVSHDDAAALPVAAEVAGLLAQARGRGSVELRPNQVQG
jgi:hypothetical protein